MSNAINNTQNNSTNELNLNETENNSVENIMTEELIPINSLQEIPPPAISYKKLQKLQKKTKNEKTVKNEKEVIINTSEKEVYYEKFNNNEFLQQLINEKVNLFSFLSHTYNNVSIDFINFTRNLFSNYGNLNNYSYLKNSDVTLKEKLLKFNIKVTNNSEKEIESALKIYEEKITEFSFAKNSVILNEKVYFENRTKYIKNSLNKSYLNCAITKNITRYFNVSNKLFNTNTYNIVSIISELEYLRTYLLEKFNSNKEFKQLISELTVIKINESLIKDNSFTAGTNNRSSYIIELNKQTLKNENLFTSINSQIKKIFNLQLTENFLSELSIYSLA